MTTTAKRRWAREFNSEIDGIAIGPTGPVLVHGYDAPAGGMWTDDVIPGKLGAIDRSGGEFQWRSPCEVGYGRGFAAAICDGVEGTPSAIVMGPGSQGHRILRMSIETGELLGESPIEPFDEAIVSDSLCVSITAKKVTGISTSDLFEAWSYQREGERYHSVAFCGGQVVVVYSDANTKKYGLLALDAEDGSFEAILLAPKLPMIHSIVGDSGALVILTSDILQILGPSEAGQFLGELSLMSEDDVLTDKLSLLALPGHHSEGEPVLWWNVISTQEVEDIPEVSISVDSGKLYVVRGAMLEVCDLISGRTLGEWTVPGLDEQVCWSVASGAGLLAEEHRLTIYELPA
jgi:uncharacterized protein YlzI (FlbEa/FlbD family)